jgi:hypothetical protein
MGDRPHLLTGVVGRLSYKPGWHLKMGGPLGRYLCVNADTPDSAQPTRSRRTQHMFEAPPLDTERAAVRWVLDCLLLCEQHEACEFLRYDGRRPFFPHHQDEGSPYELVDRWEQLHEPS